MTNSSIYSRNEKSKIEHPGTINQNSPLPSPSHQPSFLSKMNNRNNNNNNSGGRPRKTKPRGSIVSTEPRGPTIPMGLFLSDNDNDSDPNNLPLPPSSALTSAELNLRVLRRHSPETTSILSIAPFAVVYTFSPTLEWEKIGVEGTLFVSSLLPHHPSSGAERFGVTILNRRGLNNFNWELKSAGDVESTEPDFVILHSRDEGEVKTVGLWIFSEPTATTGQLIAKVLGDCATMAEATRTAVVTIGEEDQEQVQGRTTTTAQTNTSSGARDILSLLHNASSKFMSGCEAP